VPHTGILLGFKEGVTRKDFETHFFNNDMKALEDLCHRIPVRVGDVFFVGGGVPHALGEGCFVIEVQEPSDITVAPVRQKAQIEWYAKTAPKGGLPDFAVEDERIYNEKLFGAFIYDGCGYEENLKRRRIPHKTLREGSWGREFHIIGPEQTSYFSCTRIDVTGNINLRQTGFPQIAIVLKGEGAFLFRGGTLPIRRGDELFLPHHIPRAEIAGNLSVVFCHPEGVFQRPL
jgi:mannose-6-phosphate isomerase